MTISKTTPCVCAIRRVPSRGPRSKNYAVEWTDAEGISRISYFRTADIAEDFMRSITASEWLQQAREQYAAVMDDIALRVADVRSFVPRELSDERERLEKLLGMEVRQ